LELDTATGICANIGKENHKAIDVFAVINYSVSTGTLYAIYEKPPDETSH